MICMKCKYWGFVAEWSVSADENMGFCSILGRQVSGNETCQFFKSKDDSEILVYQGL